VNVETRALAEQRFVDLASQLGLSRVETIGMLVIFWHDSQEREIWEGTREEITRFIPVAKKERGVYFDALLENDYISETATEGLFVIRGNRKHVEALGERRDAAAEGGRAKARKIKENKASLALGSEVLPPAKSALPNALQSNTKQSNSEKKESGADSKLSVVLDACVTTWADTLTACGIPRAVSDSEKLEIGRAIQRHGAEVVDLALFGARHEPPHEGFNPKQYVSLSRVLLPTGKERKLKLTEFANWGAKARADRAAQSRKQESSIAAPGSEERTDPGKVREMLAAAGFRKVPGGDS
jgi:hypothetical protein